MDRATGWGGVKAKFGGLMAAALVLAQLLQAAPLRECPHHDHGATTPGEPAGQVQHVGHDAPGHVGDDAPGHDDPSHEGPCDCLGDCQPPPATQPPRCVASVSLPIPARTTETPPVEAGIRLAVVPFALPYCRPPPV